MEYRTAWSFVYKNAELIVYPGQNHGFTGDYREKAKKYAVEFFRKNAE